MNHKKIEIIRGLHTCRLAISIRRISSWKIHAVNDTDIAFVPALSSRPGIEIELIQIQSLFITRYIKPENMSINVHCQRCCTCRFTMYARAQILHLQLLTENPPVSPATDGSNKLPHQYSLSIVVDGEENTLQSALRATTVVSDSRKRSLQLNKKTQL